MTLILLKINKIANKHIEKSVFFNKEITKIDYGYDTLFDNDKSNYIQLLQLN